MIKVSIVVPVYNVERYLKECLDSLVGQTLRDIEIIAVNDGSQDGSLQILEEYAAKDKRFKIINQENAGLSAARNRGVEQAIGEFVAFVDSDDWIDLDFCEKLYLAAKENNADIAAGEMISCYGYEGVCSKGKYGKLQVVRGLKDKFELLLESGIHCQVCNKIYRREKIMQSGICFLEGFTFEDMYWSPQIIRALGSAVIVSDVFYYYRQNLMSITHSTVYDERKVADYLRARASVVRFADYNKLSVMFTARDKVDFKLFGLPIVKIEIGDIGFRFYLFGLRCLEMRVRRRM
ncbi:MAG: glycosyltransferase [Acetobacter sp.]|nr:glycosyltransferase [Acetobacter sp.]